MTGRTIGREVAWPVLRLDSASIIHDHARPPLWSYDRRTTIQGLCAIACDLRSLQQVFWTCSANFPRLMLIVTLLTVAETNCTILLRLSVTCTAGPTSVATWSKGRYDWALYGRCPNINFTKRTENKKTDKRNTMKSKLKSKNSWTSLSVLQFMVERICKN